MKKASEVLDQILSNLYTKYPEEKSFTSIFHSWEEIVGPETGSHTRIKEIEGNTIIVEADHPGWVQLLLLNKNQILGEVKKVFPAIDIRNMRAIVKRKQ